MLSESQNIQSLQAMFDYNHNQLMVEQKSNELRKTRLYMVIAILSLLLVIFVVVYLAQRRDRQRAIAAANYQTTIRELSLEDRLSTSPITTHLQELANSNPPKIADFIDIKNLKALVSDNIPSFYDTVNPPQQPLGEQEYVVCLLTRLSFPSVSIDRLTGVSEGYTSKLKNRLYKKLTGEDGNAKDFEHWIMTIK
jgi:type II secretory pathway pseudopilin PulG